MISLLPPSEVRDSLLAQAKQLEETIQSRKKPGAEPTTWIKKLRRVPRATWLFVAITIPVCTGWYLFMKYIASAPRKKSFRERGESLKSLIKRNVPGT
jgi:hypothetical protein